MPVFNAIGFPDKITTDYMNTEASRDAKGGQPSLSTGERMIAMKDPKGRFFHVCTEIKTESQNATERAIKQVQAISMSLAQHFLTPSKPAIEYRMDINDAVEELRAFEQRYAGRGRAFTRAEDASHFTQVPYFAPIGMNSRQPKP